MNQNLNEILRSLEAHRDEDRAIKMKAYMKNQFEFFGIPAPLRKTLIKPIIINMRGQDKSEWLILTDALWNESERECHYIAVDLLDRITKKLNAADLERITAYLLTSSWWDTVDHLAARQIGHIFKERDVRKTTIPLWLKSDNIWLNRTCLLYQLFYRKSTDWPALTSYIGQLKHKNDFFIQKAIGWALRQYSKTDPEVIKAFIATHELSGLATREGLKWINKNAK